MEKANPAEIAHRRCSNPPRKPSSHVTVLGSLGAQQADKNGGVRIEHSAFLRHDQSRGKQMHVLVSTGTAAAAGRADLRAALGGTWP